MATAEQIKSLIRSYGSDDNEHFYTVALQVAAHEAMQGHSTLAHEIKLLIEKKRKFTSDSFKNIPINPSLKNLVYREEPDYNKASLVVNESILEKIDRVIKEYFQQNKLKQFGLMPRRKLLLAGPPGTGKTLTARVLAHELGLPLFIVQVDRLVTKFMGETSAKLRQLFEQMESMPGVYLFDEFDAIGSERSMDNDVGEMRRVLNSFLQFIEQDKSESLLIAATNNPQLLDHALFRRFDDVLEYQLPNEDETQNLISNVLGTYRSSKLCWSGILKASHGLSHAEIVRACFDTIKDAVLADKSKVTSLNLVSALDQMRTAGLKFVRR